MPARIPPIYRILMSTVGFSCRLYTTATIAARITVSIKAFIIRFFADVAFLHLELMTLFLQASDTQEAGHPEFFPGYIFHADSSVLLLYGKCGGGNFFFSPVNGSFSESSEDLKSSDEKSV